MATINDISNGTIIEINGEPFQVINARHSKMGRAGAVLKTKLKSLETGHMRTKTMQGNENITIADINRSDAQYMYQDAHGYFFMDNNTFEQFTLSKEQVGKRGQYLKEGTSVTIINNREKPVAIDFPIKISLKVIEAPPAIKGDTAQGGTKEVKTETGVKVLTPLFIKEGDIIRVNTEDGSYVERARE